MQYSEYGSLSIDAVLYRGAGLWLRDEGCGRDKSDWTVDNNVGI